MPRKDRNSPWADMVLFECHIPGEYYHLSVKLPSNGPWIMHVAIDPQTEYQSTIIWRLFPAQTMVAGKPRHCHDPITIPSW